MLFQVKYARSKGAFSIGYDAKGQNIFVNSSSHILSSFILNSFVPIENLDKKIAVSADKEVKVWLDIALDNSSGEISAKIDNGEVWWAESPTPYKINTALLDGKFQGQTNIYVPIASTITVDKKKDLRSGLMVRTTRTKMIYRHVNNDLMIVQFCDKYVALPIALAVFP